MGFGGKTTPPVWHVTRVSRHHGEMSSEQQFVPVVVEIPRGSRNKYEIDHETGEVWLDRRLF